MSGRQFAGSWLIGLGMGSMTLAALRSDVATSVVFPFLVGAAGFLLLRNLGRTRPRFPNTDLERGLDRLFALLVRASASHTQGDDDRDLAHRHRATHTPGGLQARRPALGQGAPADHDRWL